MQHPSSSGGGHKRQRPSRLYLHLIAFSKDRPFQLGETLRSLHLHLHCRSSSSSSTSSSTTEGGGDGPTSSSSTIASLTVIHAASTPQYRESYQRLAAAFSTNSSSSSSCGGGSQSEWERSGCRVGFVDEDAARARGEAFAALLDRVVAGLDGDEQRRAAEQQQRQWQQQERGGEEEEEEEEGRHFVMWIVDDLLLFDPLEMGGPLRALADGG
jgi:hypothetical protein